jgi:predicted MFS family arabinose efflux permease
MLHTSTPIAREPDRAHSPAAIALAGLAALAVAMGIGRFAFTPILPIMQEEFGLTVAGGGWLASVNYAGYLLGALWATAMRVQAATAIRGGLVAVGLATLGMGLEHGFAVWVVLRGLAGIASAWVLIHASAWSLEKLAPLHRPVLNGTVFAGVGTGITVAGALCMTLMLAKAGAAQAWIHLGFISLVVTMVTWPVIGYENGVVCDRRSPPTERMYPWDAESVRLVLCYGASGFGYIIPATFIPAMARQVVHDAALFAWAWPVFGAAAAASTLAVAALLRYAGNRCLWIASHLAMALGITLPIILQGIAGILLAALFVGGTFMVNTLAAMQEAQQVAGRHAAGLMAAMTSAFAVGQIAGPISVSYLTGTDGDFTTPLLAASLLLTASALALFARRSQP